MKLAALLFACLFHFKSQLLTNASPISELGGLDSQWDLVAQVKDYFSLS